MSQNSSVLAPEETHLVDSLLHSNVKRVVVGAICGVASGLLLLWGTTLFTPDGAGQLWWIQLMASTFCGGKALAYEVSSQTLIAGLGVHFGLSVINGLFFGKMTTSRDAKKLAGYGLVLGALCWLASNMFAPDFLDVEGLSAVGEWTRVFLFVPFGVSLGLFMSVASHVLDL